jgi:DNA helicase-2/ATP-dependent DNA helicase PcrA
VLRRTRAKRRLYLTSARQRRLYGNKSFNLPSRFLDEIPPELLEVRDRWASHGHRGLHTEEKSLPVGRGDPAGRPHVVDRPYDDEVFVDRLFPGARVRHPDFGIGVIRERSGSGDDLKVVVTFNGVGEKKLLVKYAPLEQG